mmetsp:Transcript_63840/g.165878  ORF Transcript_63840/g.165878 Transcript_63840/m.165878 type:complete len:624 (-) Transcript_63840:47-1918(-)
MPACHYPRFAKLAVLATCLGACVAAVATLVKPGRLQAQVVQPHLATVAAFDQYASATIGGVVASYGADWKICDPMPYGDDPWSGQVLRRLVTDVEAECSQACKRRSWCEKWAFSRGDYSGNGSSTCLLVPLQGRTPKDVGQLSPAAGTSPTTTTQPPWVSNQAPTIIPIKDASSGLQEGVAQRAGLPCRLAAVDVPDVQSCAGRGGDCSRSKCCRAEGEQCYENKGTYGASVMCQQHCQSESSSCRKLGLKVCPACAPPALSRPAVVIPTFERDMCKAVVLVKSIVKHDPNHYLGDVYVLWISKQSHWGYTKQIEEMRNAIESGGSRKFHFFDFSPSVNSFNGKCLIQQDWKCVYSPSGWHLQEVLKLKIAAALTSDHYVLLDSKNAFFSDVFEDTFFTNCNQVKIKGVYKFHELPAEHKMWYESSLHALNMTALKHRQMYWPSSVTPAVLHRQTVLEMLERLGEDPDPNTPCSGPLCKLFANPEAQHGRQATEFTLYTAFAASKAANGSCSHVFERAPPVYHQKDRSMTLWRGLTDINLQLCKEVDSGNTKPLTFGLQAHALQPVAAGGAWTPPNASQQEKETQLKACVARIYAAAGLSGSEAEAVGSSELWQQGSFLDCVG